MTKPISLKTLQRYREIAMAQQNYRLYWALDIAIAEYLEMSDGHIDKDIEHYNERRAAKPHGGILARPAA